MVEDWCQALSYSVEMEHFYLVHGFPGTPASCDYYGIAIQYLASEIFSLVLQPCL
jgi:hypothetical protein